VLTYTWTFDDGTTATGPEVVRTFTERRALRGTLTVTDPTGLTGTASTPAVAVDGPPGEGPPFEGVSLETEKVRMTRRGRVRLALRCPPTLFVHCTGRLRIARQGVRLGGRGFELDGGTRPRWVALSRRARRAVKRRGPLTVRVTITSRYPVGGPMTRTFGLVIRPPRERDS
jgi:hypothetical protein